MSELNDPQEPPKVDLAFLDTESAVERAVRIQKNLQEEKEAALIFPNQTKVDAFIIGPLLFVKVDGKTMFCSLDNLKTA